MPGGGLMPAFDEGRYRALLAGRGAVGARVRYRARTGSTMDDARAAASREGLASCGSAYVAGEQEAGRGRHGRRWESPAGSGLLVTYHLCGSADQVALATIAGALAVGDALRLAAGLDPSYTWPNDVVVEPPGGPGGGARKVAGVLAEAAPATGGRVDALLGVGVNLTSAGALPPELSGSAVGVAEAGGRPLSPEEMLAALSAALGVAPGRRGAGGPRRRVAGAAADAGAAGAAPGPGRRPRRARRRGGGPRRLGGGRAPGADGRRLHGDLLGGRRHHRRARGGGSSPVGTAALGRAAVAPAGRGT